MNAPSHTTHGKWALPGVPHKGWTCINVEDLEEPSRLCEMCEVREIRFVHYMAHPDHPDVLACGCVCAGHMEQDLEEARRREQDVRNAAARRAREERRKAALEAKLNPPWKRAARKALNEYNRLLNSWEREFLASIVQRPDLTDRQDAALRRIVFKIRKATVPGQAATVAARQV